MDSVNLGGINLDNIVESCMGAINSKMKNLKNLNIVVVGKSGVGKSTLINAVFRENIAEVGIGRPVTQHMKYWPPKEGMPLGIYDTKGFELGKEVQDDINNELIEKIEEGAKSGDINDAIHCIWYCVNTTSNRFEPEEIEWIRNFEFRNQSYKVPIIIVLTQAFAKKNALEMKKTIETENLDVCQVVPVLAQDFEIDDDNIVKAYGLDKLIEVMQKALPEELIDTLMSVQKVNLALKQKKAHMTVAAAAVAAGATGAAPIPFADAPLLISAEVAMMANITVIFGMELSKSILINLVSSVFGVSGATVAGKTIVANLLKLTGVGAVLGGAISGATAATMTTALGEAYIGLLTAIYKGELMTNDLEGEVGKEKLKEMFKIQLKKNKKQ